MEQINEDNINCDETLSWFASLRSDGRYPTICNLSNGDGKRLIKVVFVYVSNVRLFGYSPCGGQCDQSHVTSLRGSGNMCVGTCM